MSSGLWQSIAARITALKAAFAAASGATLVGWVSVAAGAAQRLLSHKLGEVQVSVADFAGDDPTGATVCDAALIAAMTYVSGLGGGEVYVPPGPRTFSLVPPMSNVTICGRRGMVSLKQVQPGTNTPTGFYKASGGGSITNFHVRDIGIDGGRVSAPANTTNHVFWFDCGAGESVSNVSFDRVDFKNAQQDCIRVTASSTTSGVSSKITVRNCTAITETASLFEGTNKTACDLLRLEQTWDYASGGNGYGQVFFKHIEVSGCYGYQIRTLADLKRGCAFFVVANNRTQDMYDCHLSVDGGFDGVIRGNVGEVASTTTIASTFSDFIECQGERISITGNLIDAGGKLGSGIFVTDYGRPQELAGGHNVGHQSVSVRVEGNIVKNVTVNALRLLNALYSTIGHNTVEQCGASPATIESGTGRYASDGVTLLQAQGCHVGGVKSKGAVVGTKINAGAIACTLAPCLDENGEDFIAMSSVLGAAATWGNFVSVNPSEFSPNPSLIFSGTAANNLLGFDPDFYPAVLAATTRPPSGAPGVILNDDTAAVTRIAWLGRHPNVKQGSRCYARFWMKQGTSTPAPSAGIVFQELDSSGAFLSTTYYVIAPPASWTEYVMGYQVQNASAAALRIGLAIAGQPVANTGNTEFADFRVSRHAIGK